MAVQAALRGQGAALLVDATHHAGILPIDVAALDPDFLIFPTYKWVLGPYGRAFLYVAKRWQHGVPLEQTSYSRKGVAAERAPYLADLSFADGAKRFDMGERDHFISLGMAAVALEMMVAWGQPAIVARLAMLTERIAAGVAGLPVTVPDARVRAPHVLSLGFLRGMPVGLIERLAAENVYVAPRLGRMRISPHVYNDEADADALVSALRRALG
jgi:selenocysteine lyase/cysteine desulfurase